MLKIKYSGKIKKDLKICQKRGYDFSLLETIIDKLQIPESLDTRNKDHDLKGNIPLQFDESIFFRYNRNDLCI